MTLADAGLAEDALGLVRGACAISRGGGACHHPM